MFADFYLYLALSYVYDIGHTYLSLSAFPMNNIIFYCTFNAFISLYLALSSYSKMNSWLVYTIGEKLAAMLLLQWLLKIDCISDDPWGREGGRDLEGSYMLKKYKDSSKKHRFREW